jgi:hypothetical protein
MMEIDVDGAALAADTLGGKRLWTRKSVGAERNFRKAASILADV